MVLNYDPNNTFDDNSFWNNPNPEKESTNATDAKCCCPKDQYNLGWCAWCPVHGDSAAD